MSHSPGKNNLHRQTQAPFLRSAVLQNLLEFGDLLSTLAHTSSQRFPFEASTTCGDLRLWNAGEACRHRVDDRQGFLLGIRRASKLSVVPNERFTSSAKRQPLAEDTGCRRSASSRSRRVHTSTVTSGTAAIWLAEPHRRTSPSSRRRAQHRACSMASTASQGLFRSSCGRWITGLLLSHGQPPGGAEQLVSGEQRTRTPPKAYHECCRLLRAAIVFVSLSCLLMIFT